MKKYDKALLIMNGQAGQKRTEDLLSSCMSIIVQQTNEVTVVLTEKPRHAESVCFDKGAEYDLVIIVGGDGTVHEVINGLSQIEGERPVVGIITSGTCNDLSRALYIPQNVIEATKLLFDGGHYPVDIVQANDRCFSDFLGVGLVVDTSENINGQMKGVFGKLSYYISALQQVQLTEPFEYKLSFGSEVIEGDAVLVLIANGNFIGTSMLPLSTIRMDDGELDVFVGKEAGYKLLKEYPSKIDG
ncbi:diacylglycerol/lipid kinase family protein [Bacillus sp. 2205SS5-2]|uniref:diacylglycerol/lipid kinase family protein n=1 Tax=Bacillus sp. 2205SS5-2 TaxID=3109031 RepID=UPI003003CBD0